MVQVLRVAAVWASVLAWAILTLLAIPALEGGGESSLVQTGVAAAFALWLVWAAGAIAYDRRL